MRQPGTLRLASTAAFLVAAVAVRQQPIPVEIGFDVSYGQKPLADQIGGDVVTESPTRIPSIDVEGESLIKELAEYVLEDAQGPISCGLCEALILGFKLLALRGDEFFVRVTTDVCKRLGVQDDDVCDGSIALEGPIVARGLRTIALGSRTSKLACIAFLGLCDYPEVQPYNVSFPAPKPQREEASTQDDDRVRNGRADPIHIVHYSDIHVDPFYAPGASANCSKPICCRNYDDVAEPGKVEYPAGPNGEHPCDTPPSLEQSMYAAIQDLIPDAALTIFTGDIVDHAVWNTSQAQNTIDIMSAYGRMDRSGFRVYGTAGNHEASPSNSYPPTSVAEVLPGKDPRWVYRVLSTAWSRFLGSAAKEPEETVKEFGAYSVAVAFPSALNITAKLRVISLNTNLNYAHNYWLYQEPMERDPSGQLAWLVEELDSAEKKGERVYIIGHMPMGNRDMFHDQSNYFDQIVNRYERTIAAMFFGHTHLDEFQISYSDYDERSFSNAVMTSYVAPSLTPMSGDPAFKVYTVDRSSFAVLDATTYFANMSDPNFQTTGPVWEKYHSAKEAYGPLVDPPLLSEEEELTPAFWHNVTEALEKNATAFEEWFNRRRRSWQQPVGDGDEVEACDSEECVKLEICKLRAARAEDNCVRPRSDLSVEGSQDVARAHGRDECEGSVVRDTLRALVRDGKVVLLLRSLVDEASGQGRGTSS